MRLREIMSARVVTIGPRETASAAWTRMRRRRIRHLVVVDGAQVVGVVSERDLGGRKGAELRKGRVVEDLMTPRVTNADAHTTVSEAADMMRERMIGSLPVLEGGRLVGIVTATDVFDALGGGAGGVSQADRRLLRAPTSSKRLGGRTVVRLRPSALGDVPNGSAATPGNQRGEPFAARVPRPLKRKSGRAGAAQVPANIRVAGFALDQDDRLYIRQRLGAKLGKYAGLIERITVRVRDVNGPRGGIDQRCRIKVVLSGLPSVVFQSQAASLEAAINDAITGAERAVRRTVQRRRTRPIKAAAVGSSL